MKKGKNEKKDSWNMEDITPLEEMIREELSLMELVVPSHLVRTSKKDRRKHIPFPKKAGMERGRQYVRMGTKTQENEKNS